MKSERVQSCLIFLGEFLYVCGGFDGISSLDTVERYDPDLDEWKNIARMTKNRSAAGVVHLGMISHKKSRKTIFGHKHKIKNFIKKFGIFH